MTVLDTHLSKSHKRQSLCEPSNYTVSLKKNRSFSDFMAQSDPSPSKLIEKPSNDATGKLSAYRGHSIVEIPTLIIPVCRSKSQRIGV